MKIKARIIEAKLDDIEESLLILEDKIDKILKVLSEMTDKSPIFESQ